MEILGNYTVYLIIKVYFQLLIFLYSRFPQQSNPSGSGGNNFNNDDQDDLYR